MTKREKSILDDLLKTLRDHEDECYRQMAFMNEHKFEMEREAIRYKQQAYNRSWLEVASAIDKIKELEDDRHCEDDKPLPRWNRMENGAAGGGDHDVYLIRSSKGHYFTSSYISGQDYYIIMEELENLPGINTNDL